MRIFAVVFLMMLSALAEAGEPILVRSLYAAHLSSAGWPGADPYEAADRIIEDNPANAYVVVHAGEWEPVVAALAAQEKRIVRYINPFTARPAALEWQNIASFEHQMAQLAERYHLEDEKGADLLYQWYGNPWIIRWDLVPSAEVDDLAARYAWINGDVFEFDVLFTHLRPWMLQRHAEFDQARLDRLYDRQRWQEQLSRFRSALIGNPFGPGPRSQVVNGDVAYWHTVGLPVVFENANRRANWDWAIDAWPECSGCILEVRSPTPTDDVRLVWSRIREAVSIWIAEGGMLWVDNETIEPTAAVLYAWRQRLHWERLHETGINVGGDSDSDPGGGRYPR